MRQHVYKNTSIERVHPFGRRLDYSVAEKIEKLKSAKFSNKDIALILSTLDGVNKNQVYKMALE